MDKKLIKQLLKKDNPIILEIGAHKGTDTLEFLKEFPRIKIYSFEPDPRVIPQHSSQRSSLSIVRIGSIRSRW